MCRRKCWRTPHTTSEMFCEGEAATLLYSRVGEEKLGRFACRGDTPVDSGHPTDDEHHTFHNATPTRICWCVLMLHQSGQEKLKFVTTQFYCLNKISQTQSNRPCSRSCFFRFHQGQCFCSALVREDIVQTDMSIEG